MLSNSLTRKYWLYLMFRNRLQRRDYHHSQKGDWVGNDPNFCSVASMVTPFTAFSYQSAISADRVLLLQQNKSYESTNSPWSPSMQTICDGGRIGIHAGCRQFQPLTLFWCQLVVWLSEVADSLGGLNSTPLNCSYRRRKNGCQSQFSHALSRCAPTPTNLIVR